jgi:hypothetical protein
VPYYCAVGTLYVRPFPRIWHCPGRIHVHLPEVCYKPYVIVYLQAIMGYTCNTPS